MSTSIDYRNQLKKLLSSASIATDDLYDSLKIELENEILDKKIETEKSDKETDKFYDSLSYDICTGIIKKKLPLMTRIFSKVECNGYGSRSYGRIMIAFRLGDLRNNFECILSIDEIKRLM